MTIRIQSPSPRGDNPNTSNASRQQTPAAVANLFSLLKSGDSGSIQKALTQIGQAMQGSERTSTQSKAQTSQPSGSITNSGPNSAPQSTAQYAQVTIKSIYGEPSAGLDRSGLSGIIDKSGHNLSNKEIADFFDGNPSTTDIADMGLKLGLNQYQEARALSIWRGTTYVEPIWVPVGASTIGGTAGGEITGNGPATVASGAWGNNPGTLEGEYTDTSTPICIIPAMHIVA